MTTLWKMLDDFLREFLVAVKDHNIGIASDKRAGDLTAQHTRPACDQHRAVGEIVKRLKFFQIHCLFLEQISNAFSKWVFNPS